MSVMTTKEQIEIEPTEAQRVSEWRYEQFEEMLPKEFDHLKISELAASDVSPHDLRKILEKGCEPNLAIQIVL